MTALYMSHLPQPSTLLRVGAEMPDECSVFDQYDVRAVIGGYRLLEFVAQKHKWSVYDKDGTPRGSFMQRAKCREPNCVSAWS